MRVSERYSASNGSCLHQDFAGQGRVVHALAPTKNTRPKVKIQSPQALVKFSPKPSPTPPPTEVYSRHDHTTKFPTPNPLPPKSRKRSWRAAPLTPLPPCGRGGAHDRRSWEVRGFAKHTKPHPAGTCEGRYPYQEGCTFRPSDPPSGSASAGPKDRPPQRRVRPDAPPKPKSFHPRSCSQTGVGANPAQA
jgi:hypothetical protein